MSNISTRTNNDKEVTCVICGNIFLSKSYSDKKLCSKECVNKFISQNKTKYTEEDIQRVLELRKKGVTRSEITKQTGVSISKIKRICESRGVLLTKEKSQENAMKAKLDKDPDALSKMRSKITKESRKKASIAIRETYNKNKEHYHKIFSDNAKKAWKNLKSDPDKLALFVTSRSKKVCESKLGMTLDEFDLKMAEIKERVENKRGSVCGLASSMGLDPNTVTRYFHRNDLGGLVDGTISTPEKEVLNFIEELLPEEEVISNIQSLFGGTRSEIDIYIPSKKFCIEFNGLYFHSSKCPSWEYGKELKKYENCNKQGLTYFMIFEDEWNNFEKRDIIKSMIKHRLGLSSAKSIRASSLNLVKLKKNNLFKDFFDRNHLDFHAPASYSYALVDEFGKIYSAMSFRVMKDGNWEIARFASDYDYKVHGAASKLLSKFKGKLVTFSDNRISSGNVYKRLGFTEIIRKSQPNYYYTDLSVRIKRNHCFKLHDLPPSEQSVYKTELQQASAGLFSEKIFGDRRPLYRIEGVGTKRWEKVF